MLSSGAVAAGGIRVSSAAPVGPLRRLEILSAIPRNDPQSELLLAVLCERFRQGGWVCGRDLDIGFHWVGSDMAHAGRLASELAQTKPEAFLAVGAAALSAAQQATRIVPIIFTLPGDQVDVEALADLDWPGTNLAGIADFESASLKRWLELLAACAPRLRRVALIVSTRVAGIGLCQTGCRSYPSKHTMSRRLPVRSRALQANRIPAWRFCQTASIPPILTRSLRSRPAIDCLTISSDPRFARCGGLISYGANVADIYQRVALYIDLVLRGTKPSQLEMGRPIVFDLVVNLRTAKALGLRVPPSIIACADEVIG